MSKGRVEQAVANLKALEHGGMADVVASARAEYEAEIEMAQAEENRKLEAIKAREAKMEADRIAAQKRREEQEKRDRIKAAKLAEERKAAEKARDQARIAAAQKLKEKAEREEAARHARELKEANDRAARAAEAKKEREAIETQQAAERERLAKAEAAEEKMRQKARENGVHVSLLNAMPTSQFAVFRRACAGNVPAEYQPALWADVQRVTDEIAPMPNDAEHDRKLNLMGPYLHGRVLLLADPRFPNPAEHHGIIKDALVHFRTATRRPVVGDDEIRQFINREAMKSDAFANKLKAEQEARWEAEQWERKADRVMNETSAAFGRVASALQELQQLMNEADTPERVELVVREAQTSHLRHNLDVTESAITKTREAFDLWRSSLAKGSTFTQDMSVIDVQ